MSDLLKKEESATQLPEFKPADYLDTNFRCRAYQRDYEYEAHTILRSKVEMFLLTTLNNTRMKEWLPGKQGKKNYEIKGGPFSVNLEYIANNPCLICRTDNCPIFNTNDPYFGIEASHQDYFIGARHFFVRTFSVFNPIPKWVAARLEGSEQSEHDVPKNNDPAVILEKTDRQSTEHLAYHFGISKDITEEINFDGSAWSQSTVNMTYKIESDERFIPFLVEGNVLAYSVIVKKINGKTVFLPVTFYVRTDDPTEILLYIMPNGKYPLYDANLIYKNQNACIFLFDILDIAISNSSTKDAIFSSFYGGITAVKKTDFSPLFGRDVYWLLIDRPGAGTLEKYRVALEVYGQLLEHGVNFKIIKFKNQAWNAVKNPLYDLEGKFDGFSVMTVKEFLADAKSNKVHIPDTLKEDDYGLINGEVLEKIKDEPYLIEPILRRSSWMVLFAATGVGKSWAGLSIALALVHGKNVFQNKWKIDGKIRKVFYCSGEMRKGEIGERVERLHEAYADNQVNKKNFILKRGTYHDLASTEGQEDFSKAINYAAEHEGTPGLKVSLVVIDNLATLTVNGEYAANWEKFYRWMCGLMDDGISIIVIHHTNRKNEISGTSKISDKTHMKIHAIQASENDNVALLLKAEKIRSEPKSSSNPFKAEINLKTRNTGWIVTELSPAEAEKLNSKIKDEDKAKTKKLKKTVDTKAKGWKAWKAMTDDEREAAIRDGWRRSYSSKQIASNLDASESTVTTFRKLHKLRAIDLKNGSTEPTT